MNATLKIWQNRFENGELIRVSQEKLLQRILVIASLVVLTTLHGSLQRVTDMLGTTIILNVAFTLLACAFSTRSVKTLGYTMIGVSLAIAAALLLGGMELIIVVSDRNLFEIVVRTANVLVIISLMMTYPMAVVLTAIADLLTSGNYDSD